MALLGVPYRLAYEAKNFTSGLSNIIAVVLRPDGSFGSAMSMAELTAPGFAGIYAAQYASSTSDPEGEYLAVVISPTDNVRDVHRFTLELRPTIATAPFMPALLGVVPDQPPVAGMVGSGGIIGEVMDNSQQLGGSVGQPTVDGQVPDPGEIDGSVT